MAQLHNLADAALNRAEQARQAYLSERTEQAAKAYWQASQRFELLMLQQASK